MSSATPTLGGLSRCGRVLGPSLDKIIKNASWRKHSNLVATCKSTLEKLECLADSSSETQSPLFGLSSSDAQFVLQPILLALDSAYPKVVDPALECTFKLFSLGIFLGEIDCSDGDSASQFAIVYKIIDSVCKAGGLGDEAIELGVLRVLLSAVRSPAILIRADCLSHIVRTCYNIYLGGVTGTNQICAKSVLAQMMIIVFTRAEEDSMDASFKRVSVSELLEITDKNLNEGNSVYFCQNYINESIAVSEGAPFSNYNNNNNNNNNPSSLSPPVELQNSSASELNTPKAADESSKVKEDNDEYENETGCGSSKIRQDGYLLFKNLCKLSMKFSSQQHPDDHILLRGKILSLELLKIVMDNGGSFWRVNERFLYAIKQYLCLSLLKNSALSVMAIFQLQCSIFVNLLSKFRSGLKKEIGMFFPMLILRVLENAQQSSFLQQMTVLNLLDKISQDPRIIIDIFVNYDCDVDASNIFERIVNGLLKAAVGPPAGSTSSLTPAQDMTFRHESVKCLVSIIKSMGTWMDQQLRIGDSYRLKRSESYTTSENHLTLNGEEGNASDLDLHANGNSELSDAATLEQRRAYKIELRKGVLLFNEKPSKGIEFLTSNKIIGSSPEDVALILKNTSGLNETKIGDYLGERKEFSLKVMHAYVDSFNFKGMDFGEAIRFFLRGFRLPGEAQKIDRIMEKFAERYCKCNPTSFSSADTAYVLAYSVIMLNTDAHNSTVKDKMTKADFIRNNRGIDDGRDLPEEYLGALYDKIVKNEIKMNAESSASQNKQENRFNILLGLDGIISLMNWNQNDEKAVGANGLLIRRIQEQFKSKSGRSESAYHAVTDVAILRFMVEVCWGPMLAAFSVTLDKSYDKVATSQCLMGFRYAVHVTAVMGMQTQRDAFVTSVAKFTYLHCAADMKQKNIDAVKTIISIAIEDGDYLHEAWEHILTCLSRIEHLQLLGEGAPSDASFFTSPNVESEEKAQKASGFSSSKRKGSLQNRAVVAVVRGGSYDSKSFGINASGLVTPEQINHFIANLNLLDQIGNFELNHVFSHSQGLNSEAIVDFVKALCNVSISELQSPTDPRVFSLTKLVEIAHYNMDRIRLVWSRIWTVLSDFFVSVGLSENLSVAIFVMDSLRQLAMKFLEREELANYNFQNEFLRPFVIVMQKSSSTEIRELIVRCISQMVLSRVSNVKSGWKSVFMIFTAAAADDRKHIVLLAFETMEKIVREYFPYITETETTTFTDCVRCLLTFTNSRFNSDVSLNAIAFLRFCAVKLAEGGLVCNKTSSADDSSIVVANGVSDAQAFIDKDDHVSFWNPLLSGLSKLTCDPRSAIRKSSLEVLFNILKDHGHLFSRQFWNSIFCSIVLPLFSISGKREMDAQDDQCSAASVSTLPEGCTWDPETSAVATESLIDLFVTFFHEVRSQLPNVLSVLTGFIRSPVKGPASTGFAGLVRLAGDLCSRLSEEEWKEFFVSLKEASASTIQEFMKVLRSMNNIEMPGISQSSSDVDGPSDHELTNDDLEDDVLQTAAYVVSRMKGHIATVLLILQVVTDLNKMHQQSLSAVNIKVLIEIYSSVALHSRQLNMDPILLKKLQKACSVLDVSEPPLVHFENESSRNQLNFLQTLLVREPLIPDEMNIEPQFISLCKNIIVIYLNCAAHLSQQNSGSQPISPQKLPPSSGKKEEIAERTSLVVTALEGLCSLKKDSFKIFISQIFPLLIDLVRSEHTSEEVQHAMRNVFDSCIGPIIME